MTTVTINGETYIIPNEKVAELLDWISKNSVRTKAEGRNNNFDGSDLLNG